MDTKELDRIYIELQKRCDSRRITKEQIDNITIRFNKVYDNYIEFRKISYMTPVYTNELKAMCINFSSLRRKALEMVV